MESISGGTDILGTALSFVFTIPISLLTLMCSCQIKYPFALYPIPASRPQRRGML